MPKTRNALLILDAMIGDDLEFREQCEKVRVNSLVAQLIYEARTQAGFTQKELADIIGTKPSAIAQLEDAAYEGHSLTLLQRIGVALHQRLEIRFTPLPQSQAA